MRGGPPAGGGGLAGVLCNGASAGATRSYVNIANFTCQSQLIRLGRSDQSPVLEQVLCDNVLKLRLFHAEVREPCQQVHIPAAYRNCIPWELPDSGGLQKYVKMSS